MEQARWFTVEITLFHLVKQQQEQKKPSSQTFGGTYMNLSLPYNSIKGHLHDLVNNYYILLTVFIKVPLGPPPVLFAYVTTVLSFLSGSLTCLQAHD